MSYPPPGPGYGYPPSGGGYPPQASAYPGGAGGYGYPQPSGMPMPGDGPGYGAPNPYGGGMPMPGGPGGMPTPGPAGPYASQPPYAGQGMPAPDYSQSPISFGGAAYAASAFQSQTPLMPLPGGYPGNTSHQSPYGAPQPPAAQASPYAPPPATGYGQPQPAPPPATGYGQPQPAGPYGTPSHSRNTPSPAHQPPVSQMSGMSISRQPPKEPATQGTIKDYSPFNAEQDAELLRKAMKGLGCDNKAVCYLICTRSNKQRRKMLLEFQTMYGKDLIKELKGELSGNFETLIIALMTPPDEFDAHEMKVAMKGLGTDERALIEILCTRTNDQIKAASTAFKRLYKKDLEKELIDESSGHFKKFLVSLAQGSRDETLPLDHKKAAEDAQVLYKAGEARWGTDEAKFNSIFATRSYAQLRLTFDEYQKISKHSMEKAIKKEMSGDLEDGMTAIVKCARDRPAFFAERLYKSMKGLGTDDQTLIRIMVSRSEIDMVQIKDAFKNIYGQTLERFITDDTSGSYNKALLQLCGNA